MSHFVDTAPDSITPVIAWRCWSARWCDADNAWRLASPAYDTRWPVGHPCMATCDIHPHRAPNAACTCGIWALDAPGADVMRMARHGGAPVLGKVAGWGTIIEGERGWRMEYAYPHMLVIPDFAPLAGGDIPTPDALQRDLAAYGVPVSPADVHSLVTLLRGGPMAIGAHR